MLGKQAIDVDDNQVAQLLAEYLGWGQGLLCVPGYHK